MKTTGKWAVLQPDEPERTLNQRGVLSGKTLVDLQRGDVPVRVMNLSQYPRHVQKGIQLATCEPVSSVVQNQVEPAQTHVSLPETLPLHVKQLYDKAAPNLLPIKGNNCSLC